MNAVAEFSTVGFYREAWLVVARGGWWQPKEILEQLPPDIEVTAAHSLLWHMSRRHDMLAVRGDPRHREYAVMPHCKVPKGVTVGEIVKAVAAGAKA